MVEHILILGAGPTALTTALALTTYLPAPQPRISLFEIRPALSTIGGAVNLTPKALRYLHHLGVYDLFVERRIGAECQIIELFDKYSGAKYAELDFRGSEGKGMGRTEGDRFFARRVVRSELVGTMLEVLKQKNGVNVVFGKKVISIEETNTAVTLTFEDGSTVSGDCLTASDGIHSAVRSLLIDPQRTPTYTGISVAMATATLPPGTPPPPWTTTGLVSSRRGSLMCSYFQPDRRAHYIGAVMEIADVGSREGWKARGEDQEAIKRDLLERFRSESMPANEAILEAVGDWTLYPVFALPKGGKWVSRGGRCVLLGDAAHAVSVTPDLRVSMRLIRADAAARRVHRHLH